MHQEAQDPGTEQTNCGATDPLLSFRSTVFDLQVGDDVVYVCLHRQVPEMIK